MDDNHTGGDAHDQYRLPRGELDGDGTPQQVYLLALSGGGFRGLFSARLLARIETELLSGRPIGEHVDLIAGTSVGGIIATALAHGVPARVVCDVLRAQGGRIFPTRRFKAARKLLGPALYSAEALRAAIHDCLPAQATAQPLARLAKPLLLTTVDWVSAELRLLGSGPTPVIDLCMFAQERQAVADCSAALGSHYLRLNRHPSGEQIAAAAFDSATQASTDILIGLADQEFDAIRGDKARLGRLLQMLRP